jgi:hypothetical protein
MTSNIAMDYLLLAMSVVWGSIALHTALRYKGEFRMGFPRSVRVSPIVGRIWTIAAALLCWWLAFLFARALFFSPT